MRIPSAPPESVWAPCGTCWGQRRLYVALVRGGRLTPRTCPACMGLGERLCAGRGAGRA
ncbi:hypothetical protein [Miltoncostaea marina]|uniref:hypothetical protein n=1 Tax=Miltoncostaea marina TaxID=2843215 RepID=UPI001C3C325A|nr:hypothetical protein [Miltoncostaea marina]